MNIKSCKKGIALISVALVIMVLVMISGIVTYVSYDIIEISKQTSYAKELENISDAVEEYYAVNGSIPALSGGLELTVEEYKKNIEEINGSKITEILAEEITANNDEEAIFYEIDISKIGIEDLKLGLKSNEYDIFLISNESHNVYYYQGYEINGNVYFSNINIMDKND